MEVSGGGSVLNGAYPVDTRTTPSSLLHGLTEISSDRVSSRISLSWTNTGMYRGHLYINNLSVHQRVICTSQSISVHQRGISTSTSYLYIKEYICRSESFFVHQRVYLYINKFSVHQRVICTSQSFIPQSTSVDHK